MNNSTTWEIVQYFHPALLSIDFRSQSTKVKVILSSTAAFASLFVLSMFVAQFFRTYKALRFKEKVFWHLTMVRAAFGVFGGVMGGWAVFNKTSLDADVVFGTTQSSYFAICVTVGFFIFECTALGISDITFRSFRILLSLHHWFALAAYSFALFLDAGHCFAAKGLLLEMSTPFTAVCWTLLKCGKENTILWKVNQFLMIHAFHCRNVVELLFLYISYHNWTHIWATMPWLTFLNLYVPLFLVMFLMTPYWTYKKTAQMFDPVDWNFEDKKTDIQTNGFVKKMD